MSYVQLSGGIGDVSKGIISFWFRVPGSSMRNVKQDIQGWQPPLTNVIPLVVIGPAGSASNFTGNFSQVPMTEIHVWSWPYDQTPSSASPIFVPPNPYPWVMSDGRKWGQPLAPDGIPVQHVLWEYASLPDGPGQGSWTLVEPLPGETRPMATVGNLNKEQPRSKNPTVIGVDLTGDIPMLYVNLETGVKPTVSGLATVQSSIQPLIQWSDPTTVSSSFTYFEAVYPLSVQTPLTRDESAMQTPPMTIPPDSTTPYTSDPAEGANQGRIDFYSDTSDIEYGDTTAAFSNNPNSILVTPDKWHHVLVSFEINACSVTGLPVGDDSDSNPMTERVQGFSRMWIAMDNINYVKKDLSDKWLDPGKDKDGNQKEGGDPNAVLTDVAYMTANSATAMASHTYTNDPQDDPISYFGTPFYSAGCTSIASGNIGLPATADFVNNIFHIELAEFQMWSGQSLETGVAASRRLFVDYKRDANGGTIPDKDGKPHLQPTPPQIAAKQLGAPTVMLHGSSKWIHGSNTGSIQTQFKPTGKIVRYQPDPTLDGNQGAPQ